MNVKEYSDGYEPEHQELIPGGFLEAEERLEILLSGDLEALEPKNFLLGWWAAAWLNPGLHPDDFEVWDDEFKFLAPSAAEAFRRFEAGEISDSQLFPAEATHNRIWKDSMEVSA